MPTDIKKQIDTLQAALENAESDAEAAKIEAELIRLEDQLYQQLKEDT